MSTYLLVEAAVLARCRAYASGIAFRSANSSRDNWQVIDADDLSLVVEMGGDTLEGDRLDGYGTQGNYQERHQIRITVLRATGTGEAGAAAIIGDLKATTEALKDSLRADRLAGVAGVVDMTILRTSAVLERMARNGAPTHVLQQITLMVACEGDL